MRILKFILFLFALCLLVSASYGQGVLTFGATRPQDTGITKGQVKVTALANSNPLKFVTVGPTGILSLAIPPGGGNADSFTFFTNYRADTMRSNIYFSLGGKLNKSDSNSIYGTKYGIDSSVFNTRTWALATFLQSYIETDPLSFHKSDSNTYGGAITYTYGNANYIQTVNITAGAGINISGSPATAPAGSFTITNTSPSVPSGGGGGKSYYFNGSVPTDVVGYEQMSKTPVFGAGTDFTITNSTGYIASFLTDANDPGLLNIPVGNWTFSMYFAASNNTGHPTFYVELYKYNGSTFTLLASSSANPEEITNGSVVDVYYTLLPVAATTLSVTDRIAIRVYVNTDGNRTITLHTEDSNLSSVLSTFSTGISAINGLTDAVQTFTTGTSGTNFNISSASGVHSFNLPVASSTNTGKLSNTDWTTFNNKVSSVSGTSGRISSTGGATPVLDLVTVNATPATYGSSTAIPVVTVDAYGRATTITTVAAPTGTVSSVGFASGSGISLTGTTNVTTTGTVTISAEVTASNVVTLSGKRINPRVSSATSYTTSVTIDGDNYDNFSITALNGALLFNAPSGTPTDGQVLIIRVRDNGTARALTWNAIFTGTSLPTTTTISTTKVIALMYNSALTKWECLWAKDV